MSHPSLKNNVFPKRNKGCPLSKPGGPEVDYKNLDLLNRYTSERGKIMPTRITMVSAKKQRALAKAIKQARALALMPYINN